MSKKKNASEANNAETIEEVTTAAEAAEEETKAAETAEPAEAEAPGSRA